MTLTEVPAQWLALLLSIIIAAVTGTWWVASALAKSEKSVDKRVEASRHLLRSEMQTALMHLHKDISDEIMVLKQADVQSERRTDRQIDLLMPRIAQLEQRLTGRGQD